MNEKLEKLNRQKTAAEKKLIAAPCFNKGAIIHRLKVVHCVLPKAPCRELMISAQDKPSAPIIQWKLHFPCAG